MADRDILFRIGVTDHPETAKRLGELAESVKRTMQGIESSILTVGRVAAATSKSLTGAGIGAGKASLGGGGSGGVGLGGGSAGLGGDRLGGLREEAKKESRAAGKEAAEVMRKSFTETVGKLGGLSSDDMRTLLGADDKDLLALAKDQSETYAKQLRDNLSKQLGVSGESAAELFGAKGGAGLKQQQAEYAGETKRVNAELEDQLGKLEQLKTTGDQSTKALSQNFRETASKAEEAASGIAQMASGVAFLFADSEDAKKLVDTLLAIKGTTDIALGGFKAIAGVGQVFSLLKDRVSLLATQQKNQADQTKLAGAATANYVRILDREGIELIQVTEGNRRHAAGLRQVATAATQAAAAEARLNAEQSKPVPRARRLGGRLAGLGGGLASLVGFQAIGAATGGNSLLAGAGSLGLDALLAGGLGGLGGGALGGGAAAVGGGAGAGGVAAAGAAAGGVALGTLAVGAAAAAAALVALGAVVVVAKESIDNGYLGGAKVGGILDTVATWSVQLLDFAGDITDWFDLIEDVDDDIKKSFIKLKEKEIQEGLTSTLGLIDRGGQQKIADQQQAAISRQRALGVADGSLRPTQAARLNEADAARDLAKELKVVADYEAGKLRDEKLYIDALGRSNELTKRQQEATLAVVDAVKAENAERRALNVASISAASERISLLEKERGIFQSNQDKLENAAVKFARLGQREQVELLQAQQVAQSGGRLTKQQRAALDSLGLGGESEIVRNQDLADARRRGFGGTFGAFERSQLAGSRGRLDDLRGLQGQAGQVGAGGSREERERRLRELSLRQEQIGLEQQRESSRRGFQQRPGEGQFDRSVQRVRLEIQGRRDFTIQLQADEKVIAQAVTKAIADSDRGIDQRVKRLIELDARTRKTEATKEANLKLQANRAGNPS